MEKQKIIKNPMRLLRNPEHAVRILWKPSRTYASWYRRREQTIKPYYIDWIYRNPCGAPHKKGGGREDEYDGPARSWGDAGRPTNTCTQTRTPECDQFSRTVKSCQPLTTPRIFTKDLILHIDVLWHDIETD